VTPTAPTAVGPRLAAALLVLGGCGHPGLPRVLATTVHRTEEQGLDFSATGTTALEIRLDGERGLATLSARGIDVLGSDAQHHDRTTSYDVTARGSREAFTLELVPREGSPATAVTLVCERWTDALQQAAGFDAPAAVEWVCALPEGHPFALDRAAIEHVPRAGAFIFFAESHPLEVLEEVHGQGDRVVRVTRGPRRPEAPAGRP
jgi:hypothetical protein